MGLLINYRLCVVIGLLAAPLAMHADDRHDFHIFNNIPASQSDVRLVNGRIIINNENNCPQSWGFLQPTGDLPNGTGTATFEVHGSSWCNIVGTLGSGLFRYDVQQVNPITNQWVNVGLIEGTIYFQKNWGQWVFDQMWASQCSGPVTCTVKRISTGDNSVANFTITSNDFVTAKLGGYVYPDIDLILDNETVYTAWQASLSPFGSTYCDAGGNAPPGAAYPNQSYRICMNSTYFHDSGFDGVYKLVDSSKNIVSTCEIRATKRGSDNARSCNPCTCDGAVQAIVSSPDGIEYHVTWAPSSSVK